MALPWWLKEAIALVDGAGDTLLPYEFFAG